VLVEAGRITGVIPARELPRDVAQDRQVHELGDVSLLPGLVDVHSHLHCSATPDAYHLVTTESHDRLLLRAAANLRAVLLSGVTTLRDLGSRNEIAFPLRDAVRAGVIAGPRLLLAGTPITTTAGHCHMFGTEADTLDQVVVAVRRQKKLGADCIKVMATGGMFTPTANPRTVQYPVETLTAAVREAGRLGMPVAAHTLSTAGIRNCVEARVDHLIHARWYSVDPGKGLEYDADLTRRMADQGQWVDVTFGLLILGREAAAAGAPARTPHWAVAATPVSDEEHLETARDMRRRGVRFCTGLDMGMAHCRFDASSANARAFVKLLGYSPWEALRASTADSAESLGLGREVGAIRPGLAADLMTVAGDPAADIAALGPAIDVIQAGRPVKLGGRVLV
jgi:imidazolonepropionase-like amidohydrolase